MTRREGLKGVSGADPAPKGLDPLTTVSRSCLEGRKRDRFESKEGRPRTTSILIPVTRTKMRSGIWNWKSGNGGRARRHLSLTRNPAISAASYAASPSWNRDYTLVEIIRRGRIPFLPSHLSILHFIRVVQLRLYLS